MNVMFLGKVVGSVWATQKETGMDQLKLMLVQPVDLQGNRQGQVVIAADRIGAGVGEQVIVARGTPARILFGERNAPIDAVIVGIVDSFELAEDP